MVRSDQKPRETRKRVILVSLELFSQKGFQATSIREISKAAGVNISAVNYHFGSKQNLYKVVTNFCHQSLSDNIQKLHLSQESWKAQGFMRKLYQLFFEQRTYTSAGFKLLLGSADSVSLEKFFQENKITGPPGSSLLAKMLEDERPQATTQSCQLTANIIINYMIFKSLLLNALEQKSSLPFWKEKQEEVNKEIHFFITRMINDL